MNNICGSIQDGLRYQPALQIVHRCRKTAISCLQEPYYEQSPNNCRPKPENIIRFSKTFWIVKVRADGQTYPTGVETFTFENHTECQCDDMPESDQSDYSDLGQSTSQNEDISVNDLPATESTEGRDVTTSKAAKKQHMVPFKVMMRCPQPFEPIVKNNKNRCVCKCKNKVKDCLCKRIADGRNGLKKKDIRCIHKNQCLLPKCQKSRIYDLRTGYCISKHPSKTSSSQQHPKTSTTSSTHPPSRSNRLTT